MYKFLQKLFLALLMCGLAVDASAVLLNGIDYDFYNGEAHVKRQQTINQSEVNIPAQVYYDGQLYSVTTLDANAFENNTSIVYVTLPETVTYIGESAFSGCSSLKIINLPSSIKYISERTFYGCKQLLDLNLPENLESIGSHAFNHCESLTRMIVPDKVTGIATGAFQYCTSLTRVAFGKSVKDLGLSLFVNAPVSQLISLNETPPIVDIAIGLTSKPIIYVPKDSFSAYATNNKWNSYEIRRIDKNLIPLNVNFNGLEYVYDAATETYLVSKYYEDVENVVVPCALLESGNVVNISGFMPNAFSKSELKTIDYPSTITKIPNNCFNGCTNLTKINISKNITEIQWWAFFGCDNILEINSFNENPPSLSYDAFTTTVYKKAKLIVPAGAEGAYSESDNWKKFHIETDGQYVNAEVDELRYTLNLSAHTASVTFQTLGSGNYSKLNYKTVTIPETIEVGNEQFAVTGIENNAFNYAKFDKLIIPENIKSFGYDIFVNSLIETIDIHSYEQWEQCGNPFDNYMGGYLQIDGEDITTVVITPDTNFSDNTFTGCLGIKTLEIADGVTNFDSTYGVPAGGIKTLLIGKDVAEISSDVIKEMTGLLDISVCSKSQVPNLNGNSFPSSVYFNATLHVFITLAKEINNTRGWSNFESKDYIKVPCPNNPEFLLGAVKNYFALFPADDNIEGDVVIPSSVNIDNKTYGISAVSEFGNNDKITSFTFPSELVSVGDIAGCSSLQKIILSSSGKVSDEQIVRALYSWFGYNSQCDIFLTYPELEIFANNELVTDINYNEYYFKTFPAVFKGYKYLKSVSLCADVLYVAENAFANCSALNEMRFPYSSSALSMGDNALEGTSITKLYLDRAVENASFQDVVELEFGTNLQGVFQEQFKNAKTLKKVTFPSNITTIGYSAFQGCSSLENLVFNTDAESLVIGSSAFEGCSSIKTLTIPENVTHIYNNAFAYCESLSEVTFESGEKVLNLGGNIFAGTPVEEVSYKRVAQAIDSYSFPFAKTSTSFNLSIDANVGENLFREADINTIKFGQNITSIADAAFFKCSSISKLTIPANLSYIGGSAFEGCQNLYELEIEDSKEPLHVDVGAFMNCAVENLYLGRTIQRDYTVKYFGGVFAYNSNLKSVELGQYVEKIDNYEFLNCPNIYSFYVGAGVRDIEKYAVGYIPGSTDYISDLWKLDSFVKNDIPKLIWLPNTRPQGYENLSGKVNYVSKSEYNLPNQKEYRNLSSKFWVNGVLYVFNREAADRTCVAIDCKYSPAYSDTQVPSEVEYRNIKFKVEEINDYTFFNQTYMKNTEIGHFITGIGEYAFAGCEKLQSVLVPNSVATLGEWAFSRCDTLESVILGTGLTDIRTGCFSGDKNLGEFMVPANVLTIGNQVFDGCKGLHKLEIMDRQTELSLGYSAKIIDNSDNPEAGKPLFVDCELEEVYIGGNLSYSTLVEDGYSPFYRNDFIKKVTIFDNETEVSDNEFYGCRNLKEVYIGNSVERIGDYAFSGCIELDIFTIGNKVKTIGEDAFSDCSNMTSFTSNSTVPPVCGPQALDDIDKFDCTLYVPSASVNTYENADQWRNFFDIRPITAVDHPVTSLSLSSNTLSMTVGEQEQIEAIILPDNASDARLKWESDDTDVAMVSQFGNVVAVGEGSCYITVSTLDGSDLSATCFVTVTDDAGVLEVTISKLRVLKNGNSLIVEGADDNDRITVFNSNGALIYNGCEKKIENLSSGIYVVIVNKHVFKVMI